MHSCNSGLQDVCTFQRFMSRNKNISKQSHSENLANASLWVIKYIKHFVLAILGKWSVSLQK